MHKNYKRSDKILLITNKVIKQNKNHLLKLVFKDFYSKYVWDVFNVYFVKWCHSNKLYLGIVCFQWNDPPDCSSLQTKILFHCSKFWFSVRDPWCYKGINVHSYFKTLITYYLICILWKILFTFVKLLYFFLVSSS